MRGNKSVCTSAVQQENTGSQLASQAKLMVARCAATELYNDAETPTPQIIVQPLDPEPAATSLQ